MGVGCREHGRERSPCAPSSKVARRTSDQRSIVSDAQIFAPRAGEAEDPVARIRDFPRARGRSIPLNVALSPAIDSAGRARTPFARIYTDILNIIEITATL
ncbi:hypothetical protein R1A27_30050 (plasmid) [Methylobacterium sp. NMS12]|uniref:hypothetical protein n=1 Tax=Methylobacterium sp. NMS12 TaxID=3079766 RepID=UPI003F880E30